MPSRTQGLIDFDSGQSAGLRRWICLLSIFLVIVTMLAYLPPGMEQLSGMMMAT
jgi:hypothetical protein